MLLEVDDNVLETVSEQGNVSTLSMLKGALDTSNAPNPPIIQWILSNQRFVTIALSKLV